MDLGEIQHVQADYDADFWAHMPGFETIRHSTLHLGKLLGKISAYCEAAEHGQAPSRDVLDKEIVPDLLIFAARLANTEGLSLEAVFNERTEELRGMFSQGQKPA